MTLGTVAHQVPLSRNSLGNNTGAGCHILLQEIFLTQGWNCVSFVFFIGRGVLYHKHHQRSPATISKSTFPVLFYFLCWIFPSRLSPSPSAFQHTQLYPVLIRLHRQGSFIYLPTPTVPSLPFSLPSGSTYFWSQGNTISIPLCSQPLKLLLSKTLMTSMILHLPGNAHY